MHPNPHLHRAIAQGIHEQRIAEARRASIDTPRGRQMTRSHRAPGRSLLMSLLTAALRGGA